MKLTGEARDPVHGIHVVTSPGLRLEAARLASTRTLHVGRVNVAGIQSKADLLAALARDLHFPDYFGHNWDALDECLSDLPLDGRTGFLLIIEDADQLGRLAETDRAAFLSVLRDAALNWTRQGVVFSVLLLGGADLASRIELTSDDAKLPA